MTALFHRVYSFYRDGFRAMTLGRTLWKIILIKLVIMFVVIKFFFFPDFLKTNFATNEERAAHVLSQIIQEYEINTNH